MNHVENKGYKKENIGVCFCFELFSK